MKKLLSLLTIVFIFNSPAYSIAGFGLNINQSLYSVSAETNTVGTNISYGNKEFSNGIGLGGYVYIDEFLLSMWI